MASEGVAPPAGVKPAALFLDLATWPTPRRALSFRFSAAAECELYARPVKSHTLAMSALANDPSAILAAAVTDADGALVFSSPSDVRRIVESTELDAMIAEVIVVLDAIGPTFGRCDSTRWQLVLSQGAQDVPSVAYGMAQCFDVAVGFGGISKKPRPDRYYGAPIRELLDGHMMAFRAGYERFHPDK